MASMSFIVFVFTFDLFLSSVVKVFTTYHLPFSKQTFKQFFTAFMIGFERFQPTFKSTYFMSPDDDIKVMKKRKNDIKIKKKN